MAKHEVKCVYCSVIFDANKEEFVQIGRRYAHKTCYDAAGGQSPYKQTKAKKEPKPEDNDLTQLKDYIYSLFGENTNWAVVQKQIKKYKEENGYSYSGMRKALIYFYEVKHNSKEKANNCIAIIPFCYQDAYNYYYNLYMAQQATQDKTLFSQIKEYIIRPPKPRGTKKKFFKIEEGENEEQ